MSSDVCVDPFDIAVYIAVLRFFVEAIAPCEEREAIVKIAALTGASERSVYHELRRAWKLRLLQMSYGASRVMYSWNESSNDKNEFAMELARIPCQ